jgi:hypothetical protein
MQNPDADIQDDLVYVDKFIANRGSFGSVQACGSAQSLARRLIVPPNLPMFF